MKILIIDDNEDIRFTVSEICEFVGWSPLLATNGREGVEKFKEAKPDLVVVDYHMPMLDGMETVEKIREADRTVPIVVLTVDERQEVADEFLSRGATDFALKPIKAPDLIARIKVNLRIGQLIKNEVDLAEDNVKGISGATQRIIVDFMQRQPDPVTLEEITEGVELAYQTVHRYLMNMVKSGRVVTVCDYGKVGRPKNKYKLV
ncbi:MAG TPA: response regulator [Bacillota bacterium]|nr:response regulator [Bacillota bacterium]